MTSRWVAVHLCQQWFWTAVDCTHITGNTCYIRLSESNIHLKLTLLPDNVARHDLMEETCLRPSASHPQYSEGWQHLNNGACAYCHLCISSLFEEKGFIFYVGLAFIIYEKYWTVVSFIILIGSEFYIVFPNIYLVLYYYACWFSLTVLFVYWTFVKAVLSCHLARSYFVIY